MTPTCPLLPLEPSWAPSGVGARRCRLEVIIVGPNALVLQPMCRRPPRGPALALSSSGDEVGRSCACHAEGASEVGRVTPLEAPLSGPVLNLVKTEGFPCVVVEVVAVWGRVFLG